MIQSDNGAEFGFRHGTNHGSSCQSCQGELAELSLDGVELRKVLYRAFGLTKATSGALLDTLSFGLEQYSIYLGDRTQAYTMAAVDRAICGLLGAASSMVLMKVHEDVYHKSSR